MSLIKSKAVTPSLRHRTKIDLLGISKKRPEKGLVKSQTKRGGRNAQGKVTVRHQGGGEKRLYRIIDFIQDKKNIKARVAAIEYDPNRTANIALLIYEDGEKRYILAPNNMKVEDKVLVGEQAELATGNRLPLSHIPAGMPIHNLELSPGSGGKIAKTAGSQALIQSKEGEYAIVHLPSGEVRRVLLTCYASLGQVSNLEWENVSLGKAGRKRHLGIRPTVRGVAMHPNAHPHGGGEGRSGIGMPGPKSPWGKPVGGVKTRKRKKHSDKLIIKRRK